mgnify:CR=1 FL=1
MWGGMGGWCWCVLSFSLIGNGFGGVSGDSFVREVFIVCVDVCFAIKEFANAIGGR